jgi:hypothetical protein
MCGVLSARRHTDTVLARKYTVIRIETLGWSFREVQPIPTMDEDSPIHLVAAIDRVVIDDLSRVSNLDFDSDNQTRANWAALIGERVCVRRRLGFEKHLAVTLPTLFLATHQPYGTRPRLSTGPPFSTLP